MRDGDRISIYPRFETFDITPLLRVRPQPLRALALTGSSYSSGQHVTFIARNRNLAAIAGADAEAGSQGGA